MQYIRDFVSHFKHIRTGELATWENVTQAVARLSTLDEAEFQEIANSGDLTSVFPYHVPPNKEPVDELREEDLVEAEPRSLTPAERLEIDREPEQSRQRNFYRDLILKARRKTSGSGSSG